MRSDFQARLEDSETLRQQELSDLQTNFERKYQRFKEFQIDIEKINVELQEQNLHVREQFKGKEEEVDRLRQEAQALEGQVEREVEAKMAMERACGEVLARCEELAVQKGILKRELKIVQTHYLNS